MERYLEVKDGLYFPIDSTDWDEMKELAIAKYNELKESKKYPYLRLVCSQYWASEGYWIEFAYFRQRSISQYKQDR